MAVGAIAAMPTRGIDWGEGTAMTVGHIINGDTPRRTLMVASVLLWYRKSCVIGWRARMTMRLMVTRRWVLVVRVMMTLVAVVLSVVAVQVSVQAAGCDTLDRLEAMHRSDHWLRDLVASRAS